MGSCGALPFPLLPIAGLAGLKRRILWRYPHHTRDFTTTVLPGLAEFDVLNTESMARKSSKLKEEDRTRKTPQAAGSKAMRFECPVFRRHRRLLLKPFLIKTGLITILALGTLHSTFRLGVARFARRRINPPCTGILPYLAYLLFNQEHMAQKCLSTAISLFCNTVFTAGRPIFYVCFLYACAPVFVESLAGHYAAAVFAGLPKIGFDWADILVCA